jgi:hypothetical protein
MTYHPRCRPLPPLLLCPPPFLSCSTGAKKEASKKAAAPAKEPEEYKGFGKR